MPNAEHTESSPFQLNIPVNRPWLTSLLSWRPKKSLQRGNRATHSLPEAPSDPLTVINSPEIVPPPEEHEVHSRSSACTHFPPSTYAEDPVPDPPKSVTMTATPWLSGIPPVDELITSPEYPSTVEEARHVMSLVRAIRDERSAIKDAAAHTFQETIVEMERAQTQLRVATDSWMQSEEGVGIVSALIRSKDLPIQLIFNTSRSHVAQSSASDDSESCTSFVDSLMSDS